MFTYKEWETKVNIQDVPPIFKYLKKFVSKSYSVQRGSQKGD